VSSALLEAVSCLKLCDVFTSSPAALPWQQLFACQKRFSHHCLQQTTAAQYGLPFWSLVMHWQLT